MDEKWECSSLQAFKALKACDSLEDDVQQTKL